MDSYGQVWSQHLSVMDDNVYLILTHPLLQQ